MPDRFFNSGVCGLIALAFATTAGGQAPVAVESAQISKDAFSTGTLTAADGALHRRLWANTDQSTISNLLDMAPETPATPAIGELMRRLLLTEAPGPAGDNTEIGGKKLVVLANAGFVDDAITIASLSSALRSDAYVNQVGAINGLLKGEINDACARSARLTNNQEELFWVRLRAFCYVANDERDAADLTLSILRERGGLSDDDEVLFRSLLTGSSLKQDVRVKSPLQYAMARRTETPILAGRLTEASGAVLVAIASDPSHEDAVRIDAAQRAVAIGAMGTNQLEALFVSVQFDLAEFDQVSAAIENRPADLTVDALLYQFIQTMNAPEFLRDKAKRIADAVSLGDTPSRAYALAKIYFGEISALDGVLVAPEEASVFASVAMANGDAVGAAKWLQAIVGANDSIAALPQAIAIDFIEKTNLLAVLDPDTAARVAVDAEVALDPGVFARGKIENGNAKTNADVIAAAFHAAVEDLPGQAGLAALAASDGHAGGAELEAVVVGHAMRVAGTPELERRFAFEKAWQATFASAKPASIAKSAGSNGDDGLTPRVKPRNSQ
ncbi:MAG: hypothetical protein HKN14_10155 [Marinicaulis sp.]|nr:hypothetical protein [Marinicaulis sp.]